MTSRIFLSLSGSDTADSWTNKVAGGLEFGPRDDISGAGFKRTLAADAIRGNNVLAIDVPADGADKCYIGAASVPVAVWAATSVAVGAAKTALPESRKAVMVRAGRLYFIR